MTMTPRCPHGCPSSPAQRQRRDWSTRPPSSSAVKNVETEVEKGVPGLLRAALSSHPLLALSRFEGGRCRTTSCPRTTLSRLPGTCAPRWGHAEEFHPCFSDDLPSPEAPRGLGRRRMPAQRSGRYLLRPPRSSGSAPGRLRARGATGTFFSCQQKEKMRCQIPDREPKTKVFGPGQQRHRVPVPPAAPHGAPSLEAALPGTMEPSRGTPAPRATPAPQPSLAVPARGPSRRSPGSAPARPRGSRGLPHRPLRDSPGTRPRGFRGKLPKLQRDRRGGRDQGDLGDHARSCGSNDPYNTPQSRAPATSGRRARHSLPPVPAPGAKPRVPGYRAPGPPDRPGRSRRGAPVCPVPPSPPASLSLATAAVNKAAHEDVPRLRLGPSGAPGPALTCATAGRAVQRGRAAARRCPRPGRPPTAPRSDYMAF